MVPYAQPVPVGGGVDNAFERLFDWPL